MTDIRIDRTKLYERLWEQPLAQVAEEIGALRWQLAAAARRAAIPLPPSGHWSKVRSGVVTERPALPPRSIEPWVHVASPPPQVAVPEVPVGKTVQAVDPLIRSWIEQTQDQLREMKRVGVDPSFRPDPRSPLATRRFLIFDALLRTCRKRGCAVSNGKRGLLIERDRGSVDLHIYERSVKGYREFSREERAKRFYSDRKGEHILVPTGQLAISVREFAPPLTESDADRFEGRLGQVVVAIERVLDVTRASAIALAERASERLIAEQRAEERRLANVRRQERRDRLIRAATSYSEAERIRALVEAVRQSAANQEAEAWASWAKAEADDIDPIRSGRINFSDLSE